MKHIKKYPIPNIGILISWLGFSYAQNNMGPHAFIGTLSFGLLIYFLALLCVESDWV